MNQANNFRIHLQRLGYSNNSLLMLSNCVKSFFEYTDKKVYQIQSGDITAFYHYLQERPNKRRPGGLSESYIHHHVYALKLFFSWQQQQGALTQNPMSTLEFKSPAIKPTEVLTTSEIQALYQVAESPRERAVLSLFYGCGLRRGEAVKLDLGDIHFRSNLLYVREGKGSRRRVVPLSEKVKQHLKTYALTERNPNRNETAFITNKSGSRLGGNSYYNILKAILERTALNKESEGRSITLHCLRHSIATHLLESGLSVEYVRDFLGHKHLESTQIYTRINSRQIFNLSGSRTP